MSDLRLQATGSGVGLTRNPRQRPSSPLLCACVLLTLVVLAGCDTSARQAGSAATQTPPNPTGTTPTTPLATPLPIDCPHPGQPAIQAGARLTLTPTHGPVGTQVAVAISGLQPGCHLWLGMAVEPCLCETNGTPFPTPGLNNTAIQWVAVSEAGTVRTTFCLCQVIPTYFIGYPHYNVTPVSAQPDGNQGEYGPRPGDYFFITMAGPNASTEAPAPLFAKFIVTT